jgi:hypothetical protein
LISFSFFYNFFFYLFQRARQKTCPCSRAGRVFGIFGFPFLNLPFSFLLLFFFLYFHVCVPLFICSPLSSSLSLSLFSARPTPEPSSGRRCHSPFDRNAFVFVFISFVWGWDVRSHLSTFRRFRTERVRFRELLALVEQSHLAAASGTSLRGL